MQNWRRGHIERGTSDSDPNRFFVSSLEGEWMVNLNFFDGELDKFNLCAGISDSYKCRNPDIENKDENVLVITASHEGELLGVVAYLICNKKDMLETFSEYLSGVKFFGCKKIMYEYNADGFIHYLKSKGEQDRLIHIEDNYLPGCKLTKKMREEVKSIWMKALSEIEIPGEIVIKSLLDGQSSLFDGFILSTIGHHFAYNESVLS